MFMVPLVAVEMAGGHSVISIPFVGMVPFGILYPLLLIPLAIAICSNLTNMMAGFNGLEAGLGIIMFATLSLLAFSHAEPEMLLTFPVWESVNSQTTGMRIKTR